MTIIIILTCFNHIRCNIKDKLRETMIADEIQTEIFNDIFGRRVGTTLIVGLVDFSSVHIFEEKLEILVDKWKVHDVDSKEKLVISAPGFDLIKRMSFVILCCCLYGKRQVLDLLRHSTLP